MKRSGADLGFLAAAILAAAAGCERVHGCTLIGCQDQASLSLRRADGAPPNLAVSLDLDGRMVDCAAPQGTAGAACDSGVQVWSRELQACTEGMQGGARTLICVPTGKFEQVITVSGTPTVIRATARSADAVIEERTFEPQYKTNRPNGPDCEPVCRQSSDIWTLP